MSEQDIFREVDEDLRREEIAKLWDKYGVLALIGAACIILAVGAYKGYGWWENKRATETGTAFHQAIELAGANKNADALTALGALAKTAPGGYRILASLEAAAVHVKEGRKGEAISLYETVAAGPGDATLKDFARLQAAALRLDDADAKEIASRLEGLNADNNPWRYSARELLGLAAFRSNNLVESEKLFGQILSDPFAPAELRKRAQIMLALLVKVTAPGKTGDKDAATQ
jgi:hypothetical protein